MKDKDLSYIKNLEKIRKALGMGKLEFASKLGYEGEGRERTYNNVLYRGSISYDKLVTLKLRQNEVNMNILFADIDEPLIPTEKVETEKEILGTLKILLDKNEQKAARIEKLENELRSILEGKG